MHGHGENYKPVWGGGCHQCHHGHGENCKLVGGGGVTGVTIGMGKNINLGGGYSSQMTTQVCAALSCMVFIMPIFGLKGDFHFA